MAVVSMKQLLEAGVHFGHQTRRWNPKMAKYIFTERNGIYIIDLQKTVKKLDEAYNFVRDVAAEGGDDSPHKKGMEMIFVQYKKILKKLGVTEIEAKGQPFDPNRHNAVMHIDDENLGENVVAQVFQAGFMLGDKVVRHAVVQVAN